MNKRIITTAVLGLLVASGTAYSSPGSSAASFMRIAVGAKPSAMGEAYAGVRDDILSIYYNPAGISRLESYNLSFTHALWFEDINYSNFAAGMPAFDGYMALGLSGIFTGKIDKYDRTGEDMDDTYSPYDMAVSLSYARDIESMDISAGASLKFITSDIDGHTASAVAADLGAMKKFGDINAGVSIQNVGTEMKYRNDSDPLPLIVRLGASYPFVLGPFNMLGSAETNLSNDVPFKFNAGVNAGYPAGDFLLSLRLGFKSYAEGLDALSHLTTGFGVEYSDIVFDYGFASFEDLGLTHRISMGYRFK